MDREPLKPEALGGGALQAFLNGTGKAISIVATPVVDAIQQSTACAVAINSTDIARDISDSHHMAPMHAMWRAGLKDLQTAFGTFDGLQQNVREEPGSIANPTHGIVTEQMKDKQPDLDLDR